MATTPQQFAAKMQALSSTSLQQVQRAGVRGAAMELKSAIEPQMRRESGGDLRLSGVGGKAGRQRGGARIGVRFDVAGAVNPTAMVRAVGPAHLLERGSKPHQIPKAKSRKLSSGVRGKSRNSQRRPLNINGRWVTGPVQHPGWSGKRVWGRAVSAFRHRTPDAFQRAMQAEMRRLFGA